MSLKRIWGITVFGAAVIICVVIIMLARSCFLHTDGEIILPDTSSPPPAGTVSDTAEEGLRPVEVTSLTVQEVIRTLSRPARYTRDITVESFWDDGSSAVYNISAAVSDGASSLRILSGGVEKRIITADNTLYIWYYGDKAPFVGSLNSTKDSHHISDEWQMMLTYEDVLSLGKDEILDAGFTEYGGENCIYVVFKSKTLGYTTHCYISIEHGLITGAEEYDGEMPVSKMTSGAIVTGDPDESFFTLPDGTQAHISHPGDSTVG